ELDQVAVAQRGAFDLLAADEGAGGRGGVLDGVDAALEKDVGVAAAHAVVAQPDFAIVGAPDAVRLLAELQDLPELRAARANQQMAVLDLTLAPDVLAQIVEVDDARAREPRVAAQHEAPRRFLLGSLVSHARDDLSVEATPG